MANTGVIQHWEYYVVNGAPVVGANVYLRIATTAHPNATPIQATAVTDGDGRWAFFGLDDTKLYDVEVTFVGVSRWYKGLSYFAAAVAPWNFGVQTKEQVLLTPLGADGAPVWSKVQAAHIADGTLTNGAKFSPQVPNSVFAGPNSGAPNVTPGFRALVDADIPKILTGMNLTAPTIADHTNAQHTHATPTHGGTVDHSALTAKGTNTHAALDTAVAASAGHIAASVFVHGLPANTGVLGNRNSSGEFIQRGLATPGGAEASYGAPAIYYQDMSIGFAVAFSSTPNLYLGPRVSSTFTTACAYAITASGFSLRIWATNATWTTGTSCYWLALGS